MHTERLTELWNLLDSIPENQLDPRHWYSPETKRRCLGGHCTQHLPFRAAGLYSSLSPQWRHLDGIPALAGFFDLSNASALNLFSPLPSSTQTIKQAYADRLTKIFPRPISTPTHIISARPPLFTFHNMPTQTPCRIIECSDAPDCIGMVVIKFQSDELVISLTRDTIEHKFAHWNLNEYDNDEFDSYKVEPLAAGSSITIHV